MIYDGIIVGVGYVGVEVVFVMVKMKFNILFIIGDLIKVVILLCNLLIGGFVKGIVVREIDVFGG